MAQTRIPTFSEVAIGDTAATSNTFVTRDSSGDTAVRRLTVGRLTNTGGFVVPIAAKTTAYTATADDFLITGDATSAAFTVTLPAASTVTGLVLCIIKIDASGNAVTIDGSGSETINGSATLALSSQWSKATIVSDGSNWIRIES